VNDHMPVLTAETIRRFDVAGPRYTSYPTVPEWRSFTSADAEAALAIAGASPAPLSLYVHIPFCKEMCTYCGCHVIVAKDPRKADAYLTLVRREAELVRAALGGRRPVSRVHLGGGTPTFLDEGQLTELASILTDNFDLLPDAELAIEVDPAVTRPSQIELLARLGFRRISMGVQDLDPDVQRAVKRIQTEEETRAIIERARAAGFRSVNLDLIYGLPRQTPASWKRTIERIVGLRPDRISLFSFAYVPTVKPHQRRLEMADIPSAPAKMELFRTAHDTLVDAGYRAIGMDHFALPEDELAVAQAEGRLWRDFQGYSAGRGGAGTIALGVSSISDVGGSYLQNVKTLPRYAALLEAGKLPVERGLRRSADDDRRREIIGEIMCNLGVTLAPAELAALAPELERLRGLERDGLCRVDGTRITLTPLGRVFVRNVAMAFDAYLEREGGRRPMFSRTV
jgi:oxygen-independent coproporphyrinogen III oxidase